MTDVYILIIYKDIYKKFYAPNWFGLKEKIRHLKKTCYIFLSGPFNKKIRFIYNNLCFILSSIEFMDKKDGEFIIELDNIKKDEEFELKSFVLALYFRSKNNQKTAMKFYDKYSTCIHQDKNVNIIMKYLFANQEYNIKNEEIKIAIKSFQNPAIIKLLVDNNLII